MKEEWKAIPGYEGNYEVSTLGRVRSLEHYVEFKHQSGVISRRLHKGRIRKLCLTSAGYPFVLMTKNGVKEVESVHRLVAKTFLPNPCGYKQVNHINAVRHDNRVENLEWCSPSQNRHHAISIGRGRMVPVIDLATNKTYNTIAAAYIDAKIEQNISQFARMLSGFSPNKTTFQRVQQ